jgi:hypothetical protein
MTDLRPTIDFDAALAPGQRVEARWTNSHRAFRGAAEVVRVNRASIRVRLLAPVGYGGEFTYPTGHAIVLPRFGMHSGMDKWSVNNGAFPSVAPSATAPTVGAGVKYRGDMANHPGAGRVLEVRTTSWGTDIRVELDAEPSDFGPECSLPRREMWVSLTTFGGPGARFEIVEGGKVDSRLFEKVTSDEVSS